MFLASRGAAFSPSTPWRQLRHCMARLRAYHVSTRSIISAHKCWPQLFEEDFQIITVPSSRPHPNPLKKWNMATASDMLGRMVPKEEVALRRAQAQVLEPFGLDTLILEVSSQDSFRPLVHGEVLVHDFVRRHLSENPDVTYWNRWRYVGSSKPTCRLCAYYFAQITDVAVRESHGNLYAKWRMLDVYHKEGAAERDAVLQSMSVLIRQDSLRTLESKLPRGRADDSSSFPTVPGYLARHVGAAGSDVAGTSRPSPVDYDHSEEDSGLPTGYGDDPLAGMLDGLAFEHNDSDEDHEIGGARL